MQLTYVGSSALASSVLLSSALNRLSGIFIFDCTADCNFAQNALASTLRGGSLAFADAAGAPSADVAACTPEVSEHAASAKAVRTILQFIEDMMFLLVARPRACAVRIGGSARIHYGNANSVLQTSPSLCASASPESLLPNGGMTPMSHMRLPLTASTPVMLFTALSPTPDSGTGLDRFF